MITQRKAEAIALLIQHVNWSLQDSQAPYGEEWRAERYAALDAIAELISPRGRLTAWARFNRAGRFPGCWWRGADMKTGGKFHRWVHGLEDSPFGEKSI